MANEIITDPPHPLDVVLPTKAPETTLSVPGVLIERINVLYDRMGAHPDIVDKASFDSMRKLVKDASQLKRQVEVCRQRAKEPFLRVGQSIDNAAGAIFERLDTVIEEGKRQEAGFLIERDRQLAEQQRLLNLAEAAARTDTSRPTPPLSIVMPTETIDAPVSRRKKVVVTDPTKLPAEYWMINQAKVETDALAGKIIPGVEITIEQILAAR